MPKAKTSAKTKTQKKVAVFHPLYEQFLSGLSSSERAVCEVDMVRAMPTFRRFLEAMSDAELAAMMK